MEMWKWRQLPFCGIIIFVAPRIDILCPAEALAEEDQTFFEGFEGVEWSYFWLRLQPLKQNATVS